MQLSPRASSVAPPSPPMPDGLTSLLSSDGIPHHAPSTPDGEGYVDAHRDHSRRDTPREQWASNVHSQQISQPRAGREGGNHLCSPVQRCTPYLSIFWAGVLRKMAPKTRKIQCVMSHFVFLCNALLECVLRGPSRQYQPGPEHA